MGPTLPKGVKTLKGYAANVRAVFSVKPNGQAADPSGTRRYAKGSRLAIGAATVKTAALAAGEYLLHPTVACYVIAETHATAVASAASCIPLEAGEKFHLEVAEGEAVAVIRATEDGQLSVIPVRNA